MPTKKINTKLATKTTTKKSTTKKPNRQTVKKFESTLKTDMVLPKTSKDVLAGLSISTIVPTTKAPKIVEESIEPKKSEDIFEPEHNNKISSVWAWLIIILFALIGYLWVIKNNQDALNCYDDFLSKDTQNSINGQNKEFSISKIKQFSSAEEFKSYLDKAPQSQYGQFLEAIDSRASSKAIATMDLAEGPVPGEASAPQAMSDESMVVTRVSQTNAQVLDIDEPDLVKTDGKNIYLSSNQYNVYRAEPGMMMEKMMIPPYQNNSSIKIINALPIDDVEILSKIKNAGEMFANKGVLVVFSGNEVFGYDISDPKNPEEKWKIRLEDNTYIKDSRMYGDKIYLVISNYVNNITPCPIKPLSINSTSLEVGCSDIYYPEIAVSTDSIFTALKIDISSGDVINKTSFVGSSESSNIYMSKDSLYISYFYTIDSVKFFYDFLNKEAKDLFSEAIISKIQKLISYDISYNAKSIELSSIIANYYSSLGNDEALRIRNELTNRMSLYYEREMRSLEKTGIMKISIKDLSIISAGDVPGKLLNQFSMDEYNGNLRLATTVGQNSWYYFGNINPKSANDVYVLDKELNKISSIMNLGRDEKIYSVRFLADMGYVVTFKQIDPFYVIDLKDPKNISLKGELKIPGYSSYLHPISDNIILGIGREEQNVKISMFDVTDPINPKEVDNYLLNEYWTEVESNHHAFLLDKDNEVFFLPGGNGSYIFGYDNNELTLKKAISENSLKRALYIDNYLYVLGDDLMIIYDEANWKEANRLEL